MYLHKYIHLIIIFAFIGNINITNANEELIPLKDLLKQQNLRSPIGKLKYLADFSLQCGSLFEAINEVIPNNNLQYLLTCKKTIIITGICNTKIG